MADLNLIVTYRADLTAAEWRLVGLALAGRLKDRKDRVAATVLNMRLLKMQLTLVSDQQARVNGAMLVAAGVPNAVRLSTHIRDDGDDADDGEAIEQYLADPEHCPKCKRKNFTGGLVEFNDLQVRQSIVCEACGFEWEDVYQLEGDDAQA